MEATKRVVPKPFNMTPEIFQEFVEWQQAKKGRKAEIKLGEQTFRTIEINGEQVSPTFKVMVSEDGETFSVMHVSLVSEIDFLAERKRHLEEQKRELERIIAAQENAEGDA